jgi:hypothetical protein
MMLVQLLHIVNKNIKAKDEIWIFQHDFDY